MGYPKSIKAAELQRHYAALLDRVNQGESLMIQRYNRPVAALVSSDDYWLLQYHKARREKGLKEQGMKTIRLAFSNISGGEGKTTLAREVAYALSGRGYKVALFDLDPQASLSKSLGIHDKSLPTIASIFEGEEITPLPAPVNIRGVDIWPANEHLGEVESKLMNDFSRVGRLREAVDLLLEKEQYDYLICDCKPQKTNFLAASIAATDHVVTPVSGLKGVENLDQIFKLIKSVKVFSANQGLRMIIPNRIKAQTRHHRNLLSFLEKNYASITKVSSPIRESVAVLGAAAEARESAVQYEPGSDIAGDIQTVTDELMAAVGEQA